MKWNRGVMLIEQINKEINVNVLFNMKGIGIVDTWLPIVTIYKVTKFEEIMDLRFQNFKKVKNQKNKNKQKQDR